MSIKSKFKTIDGLDHDFEGKELIRDNSMSRSSIMQMENMDKNKRVTAEKVKSGEHH